MSVTQQTEQLKTRLGDWPGTVVAVTKNATLPQCQEAYQAGLTHFGENRVSALQDKQQAMASFVRPDQHPITWHLIGPLQRNKVSKVVGCTQLIHSVDTVVLAQKIGLIATEQAVTQPVLLQINWVAEPQKQGFSPDALKATLPQMLELPGLAVQGLMWIAPQGAEKTDLTRWFTEIAGYKRALEDLTHHALPELSMGMSQDFDLAVHCGATIIRVGSYLFNQTG